MRLLIVAVFVLVGDGCGRGSWNCHNGLGHKLLGIDGGGGCGIYGEREDVAI